MPLRCGAALQVLALKQKQGKGEGGEEGDSQPLVPQRLGDAFHNSVAKRRWRSSYSPIKTSVPDLSIRGRLARLVESKTFRLNIMVGVLMIHHAPTHLAQRRALGSPTSTPVHLGGERGSE